ncbi:ATP-binding protein [Motiliproteus sp. SC1-56]|uniref:ATP-binding protein n=1 Tax=Motiliproteus sp. SC1-56 TaxID=2799565 RepID=UPI001A8F2A76
MFGSIPRSLSGRLGLASCIVLPLILGLTALVLDQAFRSSLQTSTREQLRLQTFVLLGAAEVGGGELWMPPRLQEPRFTQPGSGLYGLITDAKGQNLWRSPSALGLRLSLPDSPSREPRFGRTESGRFYYSYPVVWETEDGRETDLRFTSLATPDAFDAELAGFRLHLWGGLGLVALLLLAAQAWLLRWGLRPLSRLASDIRAVEAGEQARLRGPYPPEVATVTENLNLLLNTEQRQRERYRNTLADLAHSLKTPLAVIRNLITPASDGTLAEQVDRMEQIISHQLGRAATTAPHALLQPVPVRDAAERVGRAMEKVYRERFKRFTVDGPSQMFRGDERDLMEMLGNLIDNAFKYGDGHVQVTLTEDDRELRIRVENGGAPIAEDVQSQLLQRGTRADNQQPGQGIGLSVVRDIVGSYRGQLEVDTGSLGGAAFTLVIPRH